MPADTVSPYYPYRSETARESCLAYLDRIAAKQWTVASETRLVPTGYGATFVRITGSPQSPPLVLLHGAGGSSLMWAPNVPSLSSEFRTFAVDQIGELGRGVCTRPLPLLRDLLTWLNELLDGLNLRSGVNLAGMSYGGAIAAQFALRFPERLSKVVLLAPGNTVLRTNAFCMLRLLTAVLAPEAGIPSLIRWMFRDIVRKDPQWAVDTAELLELNLGGSLERRKVPMSPVLTDSEWRRFAVPALFLVGEHEVIYSARKAVRRLARTAPRVKAEIIPEAGHDLTFAQSDLVNQKMLAFLRVPTLAADRATA